MSQKQTRNFLIRNIPEELYLLLEKSAREHHRSKTQEAIVALSNGLRSENMNVQQPIPFKWRTKITRQMVNKAIDEGRE